MSETIGPRPPESQSDYGLNCSTTASAVCSLVSTFCTLHSKELPSAHSKHLHLKHSFAGHSVISVGGLCCWTAQCWAQKNDTGLVTALGIGPNFGLDGKVLDAHVCGMLFFISHVNWRAIQPITFVVAYLWGRVKLLAMSTNFGCHPFCFGRLCLRCPGFRTWFHIGPDSFAHLRLALSDVPQCSALHWLWIFHPLQNSTKSQHRLKHREVLPIVS